MTERLQIIGEIVLEKRGFFTVRKIARESGISPNSVQVVLDRLFREGLLLRFRIDPKFAPLTPGRPKKKALYEIQNRKKLADRVLPRIREGAASDKMWSVIRNKTKMDGHFTTHDVVILAEVGRENARWFLKMLRRAGFIRPRGRGRGNYWTLVKDPGPKRPYINDQKNRTVDCGPRTEGKGI
jgi:predicted transcriptional regulator of viral defense system